jgi:UDP-N-acetylglucosamine transferase subunit ALG13
VRTVLVSVGTDHHPFDRMLEWAAEAQRRTDVHIVAQRGATSPRSDVESFDYVSADELAERMRTADAVVCHGGPGTIGLCRNAGQRPIVVARDPARGEHVDDHQIRYSTKLANHGEIDLVDTCDRLVELLSVERVRPFDDAGVDVQLAVAQFGALADALLAGELPKRSIRQRFVVRRTL